MNGTKLQTTPVVETAKYFIALYWIMIETVACTDLYARAHLLSGSMLSYIMFLRLTLQTTRRMMIDTSAFIDVSYKTYISGLIEYKPFMIYRIEVI